jgi:hypothetical protein
MVVEIENGNRLSVGSLSVYIFCIGPTLVSFFCQFLLDDMDVAINGGLWTQQQDWK